VTILCSCDNTPPPPSSDQQLATKTEQSMQESNKEIGMPGIKNYQEKKLLKDIYELRDQTNLVMYAYIFAQNSGKLIFIGKCIGYGIPYATQYSNPEKVDENQDEYFRGLIPQAEPNGLFMPAETHATWLMLIDSQGIPHPVYLEPDIIVSPFQLNINQ
jgi:hypothetical protein